MIILSCLSLLLLAGLVIFQVLLISGRPLGEYAWGGQHKILPNKLRIGSIISILLYVWFAAIILSKAGIYQVFPESTFLTTSLWLIVAYMIIGVVMNFISRSKRERLLMTPVAAILAITFMGLALGF